MEVQQTVFIIDDDPGAREAVAALVSTKKVPVEAFASAEEFLAQFQPNRNGCVLVDMRMQGMSGLELQKELSRRGAPIPVVVISAYGDVPTAVHAMRQGALSFIEKPCTPEELWSNISQALKCNRDSLEQSAAQTEVQQQLATLTDDEREVLDHLMTGAPNKAIASRLDIGLRTVESRRATVLKKMGADSLAVLVKKVLLASGDAAPSAKSEEKPVGNGSS